MTITATKIPAIAIAMLATAVTTPSYANNSTPLKDDLGRAKSAGVEHYESSARAVPLQRSWISAEIAGRIRSINVRTGDKIEAGTVLMQIDCRDYELSESRSRASVESLAATYDLAKSYRERLSALDATDAVSDNTFERAKAEEIRTRATLGAEKATLDMASLQVSRCDVRAPYDAQVLQRSVSVGTSVTPGQPLIELIDPKAVELQASLTQAEIDGITNSQNAIHFETTSGIHTAAIRSISDYVDPDTETFEVRLVFVNSKPRPGSNGTIVWYKQSTLASTEPKSNSQHGVSKRANWTPVNYPSVDPSLYSGTSH